MAKRKRLIAPSILSADFGRLADEVRAAEAGGADWIHFDVMDGRFVPNITVGPLVLEAVRKVTKLPLDAHLMIVEPEKYVAEFARAGADYITIHAEATSHLDRAIHQIQELGAKAGVSLNPATPLSALDHVLGSVDMVLLMTVNPGFGGQKFIESCVPKIAELRKRLDGAGRPILLEIDGGVKADNIERVAGDRVDVVVAGSAVFGQKDYGAAIRALRNGA